MSLDELMRTRSAEEYAGFILPALGPDDRVIDIGCGPGSISIGMARVTGSVTGVDVDDAGFAEARAFAAAHGIDNVRFVEESIYGLDETDASFDACTLLSMMDDPLAGLAEVRRVLRPGGLLGVSSIEYGGLILHGPDVHLLRRFYELRLQIYDAQGDVFPRRGRELRGLLHASVSSTSRRGSRTSATGPRSGSDGSDSGAQPTAGTTGTSTG